MAFMAQSRAHLSQLSLPQAWLPRARPTPIAALTALTSRLGRAFALTTAGAPQSCMALCSPIKHAKHTQWYVVSVLSKQESYGYLWNKLWSAHSPKRLRDVCDGTSSEGIRLIRRRTRHQPMQIWWPSSAECCSGHATAAGVTTDDGRCRRHERARPSVFSVLTRI